MLVHGLALSREDIYQTPNVAQCSINMPLLGSLDDTPQALAIQYPFKWQLSTSGAEYCFHREHMLTVKGSDLPLG